MASQCRDLLAAFDNIDFKTWSIKKLENAQAALLECLENYADDLSEADLENLEDILDVLNSIIDPHFLSDLDASEPEDSDSD
jgi:hypothetical protein